MPGSVAAAFEEVCARLRHLSSLVRQVRTTIVEDRPTPRDHVLIDRLADSCDTLCGWLAEALDAALAGQQAAVAPADPGTALQAVESCHAQISQALETFVSELASHTHIAAVLQMGYEHGPEWRMWARTVVRAIDDCQQPVLELNRAVFRCGLALAGQPEYSGRSR